MLLCGDLTVFEGCDYTESRKGKGRSMVDCTWCGEPSSVQVKWVRPLGVVLLCCVCVEKVSLIERVWG